VDQDAAPPKQQLVRHVASCSFCTAELCGNPAHKKKCVKRCGRYPSWGVGSVSLSLKI
jgi:hypothetical protein